MANRRFGPLRGPGVVIEEQSGQQSIEPAPYGWAGMAGPLQRGPVGELIIASRYSDFQAQCGGIISSSLLPDAAKAYYQLANGSGGLAMVRVTDGNEIAASATLYTRNSGERQVLGTLSAANGGTWGGKETVRAYDLDASGDLDNTVLTLPAALTTVTTDQFVGGYIRLNAVPNKLYQIISNTDTTLTVASDQTMKDDWTAAAVPADLRFYVIMANDGMAISYEIGDGDEAPGEEWSLNVYLDGTLVKSYGNLDTDPDSARYWVNVINDDTTNYYVTAVDLFNGAHTAAVRPANHYGVIDTVTATVLTAVIHKFNISSPGGADPTFALGTTTDEMVEQVITITMTSATEGDAVSDVFGDLGVVTLGTEFDSPDGTGGVDAANQYVPPFTVTAGATALSADDVLTVYYKPFKASSLVDGYVFPDKVNFSDVSYRIVSNTHKAITVAGGSDMTSEATAADVFMVSAAIEMAGGRDGNSEIVDANYELQAWSTDSSPFNELENLGLGLVKFCTPGNTSTAVQKAGAAYARAKNHQYRYEIPSNNTSEASVKTYVNETLGRTEYAVVHFPTYGYVSDPDPDAAREGRLKLISMVGHLLGREARIAGDWLGYHKAQAGVNAILDGIVKTTVEGRKINTELLSQAGINSVIKRNGNFVIWGDRTVHVDSQWKFKHHREQMSGYEHDLASGFDFALFEINDAATESTVKATLIQYFVPEWQKRALRGNKFEDAAKIKVDEEINTDLTRAAGNMYAEVSLRLADTVERLGIRIGRQGVSEISG